LSDIGRWQVEHFGQGLVGQGLPGREFIMPIVVRCGDKEFAVVTRIMQQAIPPYAGIGGCRGRDARDCVHGQGVSTGLQGLVKKKHCDILYRRGEGAASRPVAGQPGAPDAAESFSGFRSNTR